MRVKAVLLGVVAIVLGGLAMPTLAATDAELSAKLQLGDIYHSRPDLQRHFREDWTAIPSGATEGMANLEDWARLYGHIEHPDELLWYAPAVEEPGPPPKALAVVRPQTAPVLRDGANFDFSSLSAPAVMVVDAASRQTLLARRSRVPHPAASLTKLMTALVVVDRKVPMSRGMAISQADEVGGARLRVAVGTRLSVSDLFYAMLVGSANNAANALARSTNLDIDSFVDEMNERAREMGLKGTKFADASGIDVRNVSTPEDVAALAVEAFDVYAIKKATTTSKYRLVAARKAHAFSNTNDLLTDPDNGLIVLGGKTGYLPEAGWNLAVKMMDSRHKPVIVVIMGSASKNDSFKDAEKAARWVWDNYRWPRG